MGSMGYPFSFFRFFCGSSFAVSERNAFDFHLFWQQGTVKCHFLLSVIVKFALKKPRFISFGSAAAAVIVFYFNILSSDLLRKITMSDNRDGDKKVINSLSFLQVRLGRF